MAELIKIMDSNLAIARVCATSGLEIAKAQIQGFIAMVGEERISQATEGLESELPARLRAVEAELEGRALGSRFVIGKDGDWEPVYEDQIDSLAKREALLKPLSGIALIRHLESVAGGPLSPEVLQELRGSSSRRRMLAAVGS